MQVGPMRFGELLQVVAAETALLSPSGPARSGLRFPTVSLLVRVLCQRSSNPQHFRALEELVQQPVELAAGVVDLRQWVVLAQQGGGVDVGVVVLR